MKISVVIPSRKRPFHLIKAISCLHALASRKHEITYVVGYDHDDPETAGALYTLMIKVPNVKGFCTVRIGSLGQMANLMAEAYPADVYCSLCDDVEVLSPNWDDAIYRSWSAYPAGLWWWRTLKERPATYAIVSDIWFRAAGKIFTDYFPFWWDDVWLMQVWHMASGGPALAVDALLDDKAFATTRMRDLLFWSDFYTSRKDERRQQAAAMARALGWSAKQIDDNVCDVRAEFLAQATTIEQRQGDKGPPSPEYIRAKKRAEALMAEDAKVRLA